MSDGDRGIPARRRSAEAARLGGGHRTPVSRHVPAALPRRSRASPRARTRLVATGPLRIIVDPHGFRIGDTEIAAGNSQTLTLAESLHALQVGQLIIAPGLTEAETAAFVVVANAEPAGVRSHRRPAQRAHGVRRLAHRRHRGLASRLR